jgi:anthranilate phosphoribosyltransferase
MTDPSTPSAAANRAPDDPTAETFSWVLARRGVRRGTAMGSGDECDEPFLRAMTRASVGNRTTVSRRPCGPRDGSEADDRGPAWGPLLPAEAAREAERILSGGGRPAALWLTGAAALRGVGRVHSLSQGIDPARAVWDEGRAVPLFADVERTAGRLRGDGS